MQESSRTGILRYELKCCCYIEGMMLGEGVRNPSIQGSAILLV